MHESSLSFKTSAEFYSYLKKLDTEDACGLSILQLDETLARLDAQIKEAELLDEQSQFIRPDWYKKVQYCLKMHKSYRNSLQDRKGALRREREEASYAAKKLAEIRLEKYLVKRLSVVVDTETWASALEQAQEDYERALETMNASQ